jgi:hypothetical protein
MADLVISNLKAHFSKKSLLTPVIWWLCQRQGLSQVLM